MNEDIKKQLRLKNKEIYLNKLNLDLDNNKEVLLLTVKNLLEKFTFDTINGILKIKESFENKELFEKYINSFFSEYIEEFILLINERILDLKNSFKLVDKLSEYQIIVNNNSLQIKEKILKISSINIKKLQDKILDFFATEFDKNRLKYYLNSILKENLDNKIIDIIKDRDLILINTINESYLKYLELNQKTTGV